MFNFFRFDLSHIQAYTPHPGGEVTVPLDRLDTNEIPYDLPVEMKEKLAWIYQQEIETNRYPDGSHHHLKASIAEYVNESANLDNIITAAQISVGNGSDEIIRSILIATCLGGEGSILVANPTFSMYEIIAKTLGIHIVNIGRSEIDFSIDLEAAQAAIVNQQNPAIRVIFIVHPNSPTANALNSAEIDWLKSLSEDILVVIDEAYFEFSQTSLVAELSSRHNWVIMRTFSKAFRLASHRVGYAIAAPELITALEKIRLPYNLPAFSQIAALLALQNRQQILAVIPEILTERERLYQALSENSALQVWQSAANFIYLRLNTNPKTQQQQLAELTQNLKAQGTLIRHTGGGIRITVGTPAENTRTITRINH